MNEDDVTNYAQAAWIVRRIMTHETDSESALRTCKFFLVEIIRMSKPEALKFVLSYLKEQREAARVR